MEKYEKPYRGAIKVGKQYKPYICSVRVVNAKPHWNMPYIVPEDIQHWLSSNIKHYGVYFQGSDVVIEFTTISDALFFELTWI